MSRSMLNRSLVAESHPNSPVSEAYRSLRSNIEFSSRGEALKIIAITSALPGEGKSTIAANIAVAYAQAKRNVLLIDANLRKPAQHEIFGISNVQGLSTALAKRIELEDVAKATNHDHLKIITAGPIPSNPSELLVSAHLTELLEASKERFDIVILDTPSVTAVSDAQVVASKCDGVVLVMNAGKAKNDVILKAKASLEYGHAKIIGAVLNNVGR